MDGVPGLWAGKLDDEAEGMGLLEDLEGRGRSEKKKGYLQEGTPALQVLRPRGWEASSRQCRPNRGARVLPVSFKSRPFLLMQFSVWLRPVCFQPGWKGRQEGSLRGAENVLSSVSTAFHT